MDLSIIPSSILSSNLRTQIIQTAINERFKSQCTIEQIRTLINLIGMNISFIRNTFLMDGSAHNNFTVNINRITIDIAHDLLLLPFTNTCIYCQQTLTIHDTKMIHVVIQDLEPIHLTKVFQSYWFLYNIIWFEFMLGKGEMVIMPDSLNRSELEQHFENSSGWWYHLFSIFWSRHKLLPNMKCDTVNCSRCVIVDGHQKSKRIVCEYKNVVDTTINEMTSIEIGCPYTPCRKTKTNNSILTNFCRYHQPSKNLFHSSDMQKACQIAVEFAQLDQQALANHKEECSNYRDDSEQIRKSRTFGFLASYHPCGVLIGFTEAIKAEGMRSITRHLLRSIIHGCQMPDALLYDCACALKLHWQKWLGTDMLKLTDITKQLPTYIALDNFHQRTHTRSICQTIMRSDHPSHGERFLGVNTQAAEIGFQFIAKAKYSLRNFSFPFSTVMLMLMLHLKNCRIVGVNEYQIGLSSLYFSNEIKEYFSTPKVCETFGAFDKDDENAEEESDVIEDFNELTTEEEL
ncbi:unnamed protein product [Adineta steineri]|uniref:Uncharacterized protein n=2 Tax=Adineta steineri TaxID=433720 RepID=A0A815RNR6_9BILA|nr:unnamed protein product [Adineta steineri]CAF1638417.1 unnamed protein product [Adineta steineri]